ncbi:glycosyl hydrolase family 18 protein [Bacillus sp. FJAT-49736]|uniref:glycosyl hydrolase family 18 protein n=1 Tax=Bacillus sp. FJAT-49736 TaxID=2833582 RepID=UPI001BC8CDF3|nr:glycosyl hydrolase family 18 protein [Bacillus sp. FJAT-49736]MBS4173010.1 peptidoglycan hydrolase [Bacillus sp. FJAT-49736]
METIPLRSKPKKNTKWLFSFSILFVMITGILLYIYYPFASTKKTTYVSGEYPILIQGAIHGNAIRSDKNTFIPLETVKDQIDNSIYEESNSIIITTKLKVIQIPINQNTIYVNAKAEKLSHPMLKVVAGKKYLALDMLKSIYPIQYHLTNKTNVVWIEKLGEKYYNGKITSKKARKAYLRLRQNNDLQSPYVAEVGKGEAVHIERVMKDYYFVRTLQGIGGYIKKEYVIKEGQKQVHFPFQAETVRLLPISKPIHLSWEAVYIKTPDPSQLPAMPGVNAVSPTWFRLKNANGDISNLLSTDYIKWAKQHHMQVWGLFSNSFDPDLTKAAFSKFENRQKIIRKLVTIANKENLDGINIDIENVRPEDGPLVTQFVREASANLHANHKYVSMDITFIAKGNWSEFYEREKLGKMVDYLIVMAYDEHWGTSPIAGSVASLPWVETNLQSILKLVPNDKLILGVPFYTRLWKEEWKNGQLKTTSKTLSMDQANEWMKKHKVKIQLDSKSEQHYVEYSDSKSNITYKMWLEDEYSLAKRAEIAGHYQLAGIASWARSFGNAQGWVSLQSTLSAYKNK